MFQNIGGMVNTSDQPNQHKLDTLKNTMINEGLAILRISEVNNNWSKITTKDNIYNREDGWLKKKED